MSLSVSKFTSLRQASLLEQAKDAISATNERQKSMPPKELKVTKQSPHNQPKQKKEHVAAQEYQPRNDVSRLQANNTVQKWDL